VIDKSDNVTKDIFDGADLKWTEEDVKDVPTFTHPVKPLIMGVDTAMEGDMTSYATLQQDGTYQVTSTKPDIHGETTFTVDTRSIEPWYNKLWRKWRTLFVRE
jgi:hypothetical protein